MRLETRAGDCGRLLWRRAKRRTGDAEDEEEKGRGETTSNCQPSLSTSIRRSGGRRTDCLGHFSPRLSTERRISSRVSASSIATIVDWVPGSSAVIDPSRFDTGLKCFRSNLIGYEIRELHNEQRARRIRKIQALIL